MISRARRVLKVYSERPLALKVCLAGGWALLIWWHSSGVPPTIALLPSSYLRNAAHAVLFGVQAVLVMTCLSGAKARRILVAVLLASAYGLLDELHQGYVPERFASFWDWVTDSLGAMAACLALAWLQGGERRLILRSLCVLALIAVSAALATWL